MNGKKIVIDAGHGGSDSGAVGNGIVEKELTLKIARYIADTNIICGNALSMMKVDEQQNDTGTTKI